MTQPKVSVIIPVYNTEQYLRQCLDSAVHQTLRDIEIICVDDGSTDGSLPILKEYQHKDPRITVVTQPNEGPSSARNNGLRRARGEYIGFLDSDDYLAPDALEKALHAAKENDLDIILYEREPFYETEELARNPFRIKHVTERTAIMAGVQYVKTAKDQDTYVMTAWIALWRRSLLEEHGITFKKGIIHEDDLFCFQSYMAAEKVMRIPDKLYHRRLREDSIMTSPVSAKNVVGYFSCAMAVMQYGLRNEDPDKEREIRREYTRMIWAARHSYIAISDEERKKVVFPSEMENELFLQLTKEWYDRKARADRLQDDLDCVHRSASFRIGRAVTWLPRKIRGVVRCLRDNGPGYTLRRCLYHLGLWEDEENSGHKKRPLLRRFADCCAQHGLRYTAWRVLVFLRLAKDTEKPSVPVKDYAYYSTLPPKKYPEELKLWYRRATGDELDLDDPKTYNEKIQWLKLYDATPLKTRLADKYLVRDWVKEKIGEEYLIPLLGVWDSFDDIDFDKLPNQFVLKANHGCGWNIIVKDKAAFDKAEAKKKFDTWMHTNFAFIWGFELQYMNIPPKIIAEEYLENSNNDLYDYKVFCFNGKADSVMFLSERKQELKMAFYDLQWKKLPFVYSHSQNPDEVPKPKNLELMISLAEKLAEGFPHVRVDFYVLNDGRIKFGEMTFTSASGDCKWNIPEQNRVYGDMIALPPKSPIPTLPRSGK